MIPHDHTGSSRKARCATLTVSDTRGKDTDLNGPRILELLVSAGHTVEERRTVPDDAVLIRSSIRALLARPDLDVILINGGTGITERDRTYEAVRSILEKEIEGFGELFRMLSYEEIGPAAMLSRATAGIVARKFVASMPGSPAAVELAMTRLLIPELPHILHLLET